MGGTEQGYANEAFRLNWVSTVGPNITAFEKAFSERIGLHSACLDSGTAAIHLGLRLLGVGPGDEVFCPTLTFAASANPIRYLGAEPVFIDSERRTWNMDPELLRRALRRKAATNRLPKALIVVHLYGQCAEMDPILEAAAEFGVPVFEDAAEALGATYKGRSAGTFGRLAAFSFNGNKIITTAGGGMLVSAEKALIDKARFWATQARDPGVAYEHSEMGYNYRMSNVLAGIGRGQLEVLDLRIEQRRAIAERYVAGFRELRGIVPMPQATEGFSTQWLSCFLIDEKDFGMSRGELIRVLDAAAVESRPVWKPMHLQPLFGGCECFGGEVARDLFERGICLAKLEQPFGWRSAICDRSRACRVRNGGVPCVKTGHLIWRLLAVYSAETAAVACAAVAAFLLRFDFGVPAGYSPALKTALIVWIPVKLISFRLLGMDRRWARYVSISDLLRLVSSNVAASFVSLFILLVTRSGVPRSIYAIDLLLTLCFTGGMRVCVRLMAETSRRRAFAERRIRTLIYGAGDAGAALLRDVRQNNALGYDICGFIDDNANKLGLVLHGVKVIARGSRIWWRRRRSMRSNLL